MPAELPSALPWSGLAQILAIFVAATLGAIAGFAFAPIAAILLLPLSDDVLRMLATILAASIASQALGVWRLRHEVDWRGALPLLAGGLAALPFGLLLLASLDGTMHRNAIGGIVIAFALWMIWCPAPRQDVAPAGRWSWATLFAGALGGVTGGLAGFPGGPVAIWGALCGIDRLRLRGMLQFYILLMQVAALALLPHLTSGAAVSVSLDPTLLLAMPPALLGTLAGLAVFHRLSERRFRQALTAALLVAGLGLLLG
jgi:uncharacterized membrane protein YfcA